MTINEMAAHSYVFFSAGFETSSSLLSYCLYEMAGNPHFQQRAHDEIDRVLKKYDGKITYESVSEMNFLENCCLGRMFNFYIFFHISNTLFLV